MIRVHIRHRRCTGLPLYGVSPSWGAMFLAVLLGFALVVVAVEAGASPPLATTTAFVLTDQAPSGLAAPRFNRFAKGNTQ